MKKNLFIVLEGLDGSGKSTQTKLLADKLKEEGVKVYTTFEPTNSRIGSIIRDIFRHKMQADHRTIAALYVADRLDHLLNETDGIIKKLDEGYTVICDRYYFSSYAYQGTHVDLDWVIEANSLSADLLRPDLNIYIDISPDVSMHRINKGRDAVQLYETAENLVNVQKKYFEGFEKLKDKEKVVFIDGNRDEKSIAKDILEEVSKLMGLQKFQKT